jgi:hypothetical protein
MFAPRRRQSDPNFVSVEVVRAIDRVAVKGLPAGERKDFRRPISSKSSATIQRGPTRSIPSTRKSGSLGWSAPSRQA